GIVVETAIPLPVHLASRKKGDVSLALPGEYPRATALSLRQPVLTRGRGINLVKELGRKPRVRRRVTQFALLVVEVVDDDRGLALLSYTRQTDRAAPLVQPLVLEIIHVGDARPLRDIGRRFAALQEQRVFEELEPGRTNGVSAARRQRRVGPHARVAAKARDPRLLLE